MSFYEQYARICDKQGLAPISQKAADMIGVKKATISIWKSKGKAPSGDTVRVIADVLGVSADYLLERTDDPTNYTDPDLLAELNDSVLEVFGGDAPKALAFRNAVVTDAKKAKPKPPRVLDLFNQLDDTDRVRVEAYIEGMLAGDKYAKKKKQRRAIA